jgi:arabinose-5-phosphate isomerase
MTGGRFGITGVLDARGTLVGAITDGDLRRAFAHGFHDRPASDVMGSTPRITAPDTLAQAALQRMNAEGITSLFVLEGDRVEGIVHIHDLLRAGLI